MRISDGSSDVCSSDLAALIHQVHDQLHFVKAFEIGHFRRITGFDQGFEARRDEVAETAAKHRLLAEQIGFALFLEGGFDDAGAAAADRRRIGQRNVMRVARAVLGDRSEEHTSELQSLMRISYAVFCLKKKKNLN